MCQQHPKQNRIPSAEMENPKEKFAEEKKLIHLLIMADPEAWRYVTDEIVRPYVLNQQTLQLLQKHAIHPDAVVSRVYLNLTRNKANALRRFRFDCRLSSYLYYWVKDAVGAELRSVRCNTRDEQEFILPDFLPEQGTTTSSVLLREEITETEGYLHRLQEEHPTHFCVLVCRTILQKSSKETADMMQRSVAWVDQMLHRAQNYMRDYRSKELQSKPGNSPFNHQHSKQHKYMKPKIQWNRKIDERIRTCMLMITHSCNLNCTYCYEAFKSAKKMDIELAKSLILKEAEYVKSHKEFAALEIDFMGGEPLTNFPLIKGVVEWAESGTIDVPFIFFITSNGTLFDDERKEWFRQHRDTIVVGVSYDGTPEMQQKNRNTNDGQIDMDYFYKTWPMQDFHMTISQETLPHLAEGILEIQHKGYRISAALAQGVDWNEDDAHLYDEQLQLLAAAYLKEISLPPINILDTPLTVMSSKEVKERVQERFCGTGNGMITYDTDGKAYGCHMFSPIVLGTRALGLDGNSPPCHEAFQDPYCAECVLKLNCPTCAGFNYRYRGDVSKRDHRWCKMIFVQLKRACEFQIRAIATHLNTLESYDASLAEQALKSYPILCNDKLAVQKGPFLF